MPSQDSSELMRTCKVASHQNYGLNKYVHALVGFLQDLAATNRERKHTLLENLYRSGTLICTGFPTGTAPPVLSARALSTGQLAQY